ncbi:MAG: histidine kinase, partial [Proteobacteria bacterium]|nr:histidine kinase [Pseudomonadota bacterium]
ILLIIHFTLRALWPGSYPGLVGMFGVLVLAVPVAWLVGTALAAKLLGHPWLAAATRGGYAIIMITAVAGTLGTMIFWTRAQLARAEALAAEARLRQLQAQVEPHFLFNTLANLDALIATDPKAARRMLEGLNDWLRASLALARKDSSTLGEEFGLLERYLGLLAVRMGPRLQWSLDLPKALVSHTLPPMLLQPLVENAIRHGLETSIEGGRIAVRASSDGRDLLLTVEDSGGGTAAPGAGVGLLNLRERLAAHFGAHAKLEAGAMAAGGWTATLRLPGMTP